MSLEKLVDNSEAPENLDVAQQALAEEPSQEQEVAQGEAEAPAPEPEQGQEEEAEEFAAAQTDAPKKRVTGFARKLMKKDQQIEQLQDELKKWREIAGTTGVATGQPYVPKDTLTKPDPSKFDGDYDAYLGALVEYQALKVVNDREEKRAQVTFEQDFKQSIHEAQAKYPDFTDVIRQADTLFSPSPALMDAIKSSPYAGDILYFILTNISEGHRLNTLSTQTLFREFGKIEARLEVAKVRHKEPKITQAPPPIAPIKKDSPTTNTTTKRSYKDFVDSSGFFDTEAYNRATRAGQVI